MLRFEKLAKYIPDFRIKEDDIGGACGARGGGEKISSYRNLVGKCEAKSHLEDPVVDGRIVLKWIIKKQDRMTEYIYLIQDRDGGRTLVNTVVSVWVP